MATAEESLSRSAIENGGVLLVGIGASAGGQDALERFLGHMPSDSGMAFVVVQHLPPSFESLLLDLLARHTQMTVCPVEECMPIRPNCVYVLPPNRNLDVSRGTFHLCDPDPQRGLPLPVDHFFRSMARDCGARAVGIILSGAGADGSLGLKAIREGGGLVLVQEPKSATSQAMPRSAISTGMVDLVLPPQDMPGRLLAYARHPYVQGTGSLLSPDARTRECLAGIFALLRLETAHDFSGYRFENIGRRVERRMALHQVKRVEDYYRYLQTNRKELAPLFRELLNGGTAFFRDPDAFAGLRQAALRPLVQDRRGGDPIRVWVPACATGEEAYSIGMLLIEQMEERQQEIDVHIFATDLDTAAIERARQGYYPASIAGSVGTARLQRFFTSWKDSHRVKEHLRNMVFLAVHSLIKGPPFSNLDLISCRNVLNDLDLAIQKDVLGILYRALKPGGFLFLGASETTEASPELFEPADAPRGVFRKPASLLRTAPALPVRSPESARELRAAVESFLLDQSPACVAIDRSGEILFVHGRTGPYLEIPEGGGVPSNLFQLAREGLKAPLVQLVQTALERRERTVLECARGNLPAVRLVAALVPGASDGSDVLLVQFHPSAGEIGGGPAPADMPPEELESALQAARSELQSMQQELTTLRAEHEVQTERLLRAEGDLESTLTQVDIAVIFLDRDLNIRSFNPAAARLCDLLPSDRGRAFSRVAPRIPHAGVAGEAREVMERVAPKEMEMETAGGRWYALRILPSRTRHQDSDGVTLTFTDITAQKEADRILHTRTEVLDIVSGHLAAVVRDAHCAIAVEDLEGRILVWNLAAERIYGWNEAEALKLYTWDLIPADKREEALDALRKLTNGEVVPPFKTTRVTRHGLPVEIWMTLSPLVDAAGRQYAVASITRELDA